MADREKVIKGLECCISEQACKGCPYNQSETGHLCSFNCIRDAIALLKEQEQISEEQKRERYKSYCEDVYYQYGNRAKVMTYDEWCEESEQLGEALI